MRLQLAFDFDLQLAHGCAPMSKNGFSATIFLNALFLISSFVKSHCTPCSFTVVMSILSSRPRYPSPETLSPKRWLCVSDSTCSQLPMNILPSEDSPSACGSDAALSFASNCSLSSKSSVCTSAARFLDGQLSVPMAGPLLALEDEAPLVAVMSCFIVTSFSPIRQNFSGGRSHSSDTARLWLDEEDCSCFLASTCLFSGKILSALLTFLQFCTNPVPACVRVTGLVMTANRGTSWTTRCWTVLLSQTSRDVHSLERI